MPSKNNKKIRNVIVVNDFDYIQGGASKVAVETANLIKNNYPNINVYFFSATHGNNRVLNKDIINYCTMQNEALIEKNKIKGFFNGIYNFKSKKILKKLLNQLNPDETIIHVHGWTKSLSCSIFSVIFKKNFKIVLTMHDYFTACPNGGYFNYKKNSICSLKPMSLKCLKCNCDSRNYFFKLYRIIRQFVQNKIVKLPNKIKNVISISGFSENVLKKTLNQSVNIYRIYNPIDFDINAKKVNFSNNKYYLYVGRVSKEKGVELFCESISNLNLKGIVVGDGSELKTLKCKYPNIKFVGWKNEKEVKKYMMNARTLIFPSRWYEAAPLTPLEIMQYGIPCIVSNCCAAIEYIDEKNGLLFDIQKINDLESKILDNEEKIKNKYYDISINKKFVSNYSLDLMKCYLMIMNND